MALDSSVGGGSRKQVHYIYDLPYSERKMLCNVLDINDKWEELGGEYMGFDVFKLHQVSQAVKRNRSPTDELLNLWGSQNHTVVELFKLLYKMEHFQAMGILRPFVDPQYHYLIREGEDHLTLSRTVNTVHSINRDASASRNRIASPRPPRTGGQNVGAVVEKPEDGSKKTGTEAERHAHETASTARKLSDSSIEACSPSIPFKELEIATNYWDKNNILGRGGFGVVFKGTWKNTPVAIKRLEPHKVNEPESNIHEVQRQQSLRELKYLNNYRHDNILPLYGYSLTDEKPCLIYQYMPNGSLEDRIQCRQKTEPLTWIQRGRIATGAARGLQFLHGMDKPLVHGDIKSANILLDRHFEPKIGDFGLAREGPIEQYTHVKVSRIHGTRPYLPDEFLRGKKFSTKVDTYSFGVVLFEIATGLRAYDETRSEKFLKEYVDTHDEALLHELIDQKAGLEDDYFFKIIVGLGKECIRHRPKDRPDMVEVLKRLDGLLSSRETLNRAKSMRHNSMVSPAIPLEAQVFHDQYYRRLSLVTPSGSFHPQQWLFASPAASRQLIPITRSTSPTHPGTGGGTQPLFGVLKEIPETCDNIQMGNVRPNETQLPFMRANEANPQFVRPNPNDNIVFNRANEHIPVHPTNTNNPFIPAQTPPDIVLFPPDVSTPGHPPNAQALGSVSASGTSISSEQYSSESFGTSTDRQSSEQNNENLEDNLPMITELIKEL